MVLSNQHLRQLKVLMLTAAPAMFLMCPGIKLTVMISSETEMPVLSEMQCLECLKVTIFTYDAV